MVISMELVSKGGIVRRGIVEVMKSSYTKCGRLCIVILSRGKVKIDNVLRRKSRELYRIEAF
jgi:hypothetical protein